MSEPLTPVQVEARLRSLVSEMTRAQQQLAAARRAEAEAEIEYRKAKVRAFHSPDLPKVTRGGHTTADRDAWVDARCHDEWALLRVAATGREIAQDNLRVVLAQAETVRSLGASVRTAYSLAGAS
jgi:hypothetical protein